MAIMSYADYTRGFRNSTPSEIPDKNRKPTTRKTVNGDRETKRRRLHGQVVGIIQELLNTPELSDTDRRLLHISSAVAFLLAGR